LEAGLVFSIWPSEVRANKAFKKGELKLVPSTDFMSKISLVQNGGVEVLCKPRAVYISGPTPCNKTADLGEWNKTTVVSAYWWVINTSEESEANMNVQVLSQDGFAFPCLTNSKPLRLWDKLLKYQPKREAAGPPLQGSPMKKIRK
jgi:hypothetical protein